MTGTPILPKGCAEMRLTICLTLMFAIVLLLIGCGSEDSNCPNPNTLSGFVYIRQGALDEPDGTLEDDVLVSDKSLPPVGFLPFKGAKITVEETGTSLELGERGAFVFHPLPAGTYTLVIEFEGFPPVKRLKGVCVVSLSSYYRPPYYYDPPPQPDRPPTKPAPQPPQQTDTSGSWDEGGLGSWGEGEGASARKR